ncbi:MAG: hypothetical protein QXW82_06780 [Candidatus Bathyarchaeia archaeon]
MRKKSMILGVILIFVGVVCVSLSNTHEFVHRAVEVASTQNADEVSAYFLIGENVSIVLSPGDDWSPTGGLVEDGGIYLTLNVTLISPDNGKTIFRFYFNTSKEPPSSPDLPWPLQLSKVEALCVDEDSIEVRKPLTLEWIGGIIRQNGTFTIKSSRHPFLNTPPRYLAFFRAVTERRYLYSNLFPVGSLLSVIGVALSLWGSKSERERKRQKLRKKGLPIS